MKKNFLIAFVISCMTFSVAADVDQRGAREALRAGEIRPLMELLAIVEKECRGDLVEVELEHEHGRWDYEISLLGPHGDVAELEYDAKSLQLLEAEGRNLDALECVPEGTPD